MTEENAVKCRENLIKLIHDMNAIMQWKERLQVEGAHKKQIKDVHYLCLETEKTAFCLLELLI